MKQKGKLTVTVLGSGTSQGIPVIACHCEVCQSTSAMDNRLRSSVMITINHKNYVIDTGPDFRQQMLREGVESLEAVFFTHEHKDHLAGLDDIRAFNYVQKKGIPIYCTTSVEKALRNEFNYVFDGTGYPGIPQIELRNISKNSSFKLMSGIEVIPIEVYHYKLPVLGFRIKDFAYITDAKTISEEEERKLDGVEILIVNALRKEEHISHFNLKQALEFIRRINPKQAYLTHISHLLGKHEQVEKELPKNVSLAYDGLKIHI